jgi:hypothetical protein
LVGAAAGLVVTATPAAATTCAGTALTWTGAGDGHSWTDAANWTGGVAPGPANAVTIDATQGPAGTVDGVGGAVCDVVASKSLKLAGTLTLSGNLDARGTVDLNGFTLTVGATPGSGTASVLAAGAVIVDTHTGGGGLLVARNNARIAVVTGAKVQTPAVLQLVSGATLAAGGAGTATLGGTGGLSWFEGTLTGNLTLALATNVENATAHVLDADAVVTFAGATRLNTSAVRLQPRARVVISGLTRMLVWTLDTHAVGFLLPTGATRDATQRVTVALGGNLQVESIFGSGPVAAIDVPLVNYGTVNLGASLNAAAGYTQDLQPGASTSSPKPTTGLLSPTVGLTTASGTTEFAPVEIKNGGLGGKGTILAQPVTIGNAWVHPGYSGSCREADPVPLGTATASAEPCAGTITVRGDLHFSSTTDLQLVVRGTTAQLKDKLQVEPLTSGTTVVAPGTAYLAGRLSVSNGRSSGTTKDVYAPAYGTAITNLVQYSSRSGAFAAVSALGAAGLAWKPAYDDSATNGDPVDVDVSWVDVVAPTVQIARPPAFTQYSSQSAVYLGRDNRRVASYDVRWRRASPTRGWSAWVYPATWQHTTATVRTLTGLALGYTYCFSVRDRDEAGNTGAWTAPVCTTRLADDRVLSAVGRWQRPGGRLGFYRETYSSSATYGAKLVTRGTHTRVAVTAMRCPTCGKFQVYSGTKLLKTISLYGAKPSMTSWVSPVLHQRTTSVTLRVVSQGKPVLIDSVGLGR